MTYLILGLIGAIAVLGIVLYLTIRANGRLSHEVAGMRSVISTIEKSNQVRQDVSSLTDEEVRKRSKPWVR